jgi:Trk K+ transport system NAD-binding subunit
VTVELPSARGRHFVVCGESPLAYRLIEELITRYEGHVVAVVKPNGTQWSDRMRQIGGVEFVESERLDKETFERARLEHAEALALVEQDDAANVQAALLAQEIKPNLRIVLRMFKLTLGERMTPLLNNVAVLSSAAIAAPTFVNAALDEAATPPIALADRTVVGTRRNQVKADEIIAGLGIMGPPGTEPETLPESADEVADLVLAKAKPAPPPRPPQQPSSLRFLPLIFGARLRLVVAIFLVIFVIGTVTLALTQHLSLSDAAYNAIIAELSGNPLSNADGPAKIAMVLLTLVSLALIPALTATIVDALVKARLQLEAGGLIDSVANHVVVVGLGDVGTRVVRALYDQGVDVVAIEREPKAPGVVVARELHIPVIIGDASRAETLRSAYVATCRAMIVASTDDVSNLETALLARSIKPDLRVVVRLFDAEFADRVRHTFNIISRSVSYLAAPNFASAMLGRNILGTIPVRRRVLLLAELPVGEGSPIEHTTVGSVSKVHQVRLLAVRTADQVLWRPSEGRPLRSTDKLIVVATRGGLSNLLTETSTPDTPTEAAPFRLLQPWEIPHGRPGQ